MAAQLAYQDPSQFRAMPADATRLAYPSFANLPLFESAAPELPALSPRMANAWAEAILIYWRSGIESGNLDPQQTLYLCDLAPREGQLGWLLIHALRRRLAAADLPLRFCYLACYHDAASARKIALHPYFNHPIFSDPLQTANIDFAHWIADGDAAHSALHLHKKNVRLLASVNPLVILAHGYFQSLPSQLFGIHHGRLLHARVAQGAPAADGRHQLAYQWQGDEINGENEGCCDAPPTCTAALQAHYRQRCNGSALTLPLAACAMLDRLNLFCGGRSLLLAADPGICNERQIRLGALYPPGSWCARDPAPPVNFHALGLHQQGCGARLWHQQLDDAGMVVQMAWRDDGQGATLLARQNWDALTACLDEAHPDDLRRLALAHSAPDDLLTQLRLAHYDPQLLKTHIDAYLKQAPTLSDAALQQWHTALVYCWNNYLPPADCDGFHREFALLALHLGHFGLAKDCLRSSLVCYGEDANDLYLLAWCEAASGDMGRASALTAQALILEPEHAHALALDSALRERQLHWQQKPWYLPPPGAADASAVILRLEPLGPEHAASLFYQYRDRQIGLMTRLPELDTLEQVQTWIAEQQEDPSRASFAVLHECWGLVGMVSIQCAGSAGYFYFWIGSDFQDQGLGQQAAQLLFDRMAQSGVSEIFTSAYVDNLRSIHALTRLGFAKLAVRAQEPDEDLVFFHLGRSGTQSDEVSCMNAALRDLCLAIGSSLQFYGPPDGIHIPPQGFQVF